MFLIRELYAKFAAYKEKNTLVHCFVITLVFITIAPCPSPLGLPRLPQRGHRRPRHPVWRPPRADQDVTGKRNTYLCQVIVNPLNSPNWTKPLKTGKFQKIFFAGKNTNPANMELPQAIYRLVFSVESQLFCAGLDKNLIGSVFETLWSNQLMPYLAGRLLYFSTWGDAKVGRFNTI